MDSADYQKKKFAETLPLQKATAHTPKAGVGQTSDIIIPDFSEKVNSEVKYSRKAPTDTVTISKGEMQKRKANFESDKVYSRSEVERALKKIDGINHLPSKMRTEILSDVWNAFNSRYSSEQRERHIDVLGNRIIATVLQNAQSDEVKAKKQKLYRERNRLNKKAEKSNTDQKRLAEIDAELEALDYFISIRKSHRGAPDGIIF